MVSFLINRPVAVLMSTLALVVFSVLALLQLPVSLLPTLEVPAIVIRIMAPNTSPQELEENILKPIRTNLLTLRHLEDIESMASAESGKITLTFSYNADMALAFIEVNERIDKLSDILPDGVDRPRVIRLSASDIPIVRIQVIPDHPGDLVEISELVDKVIRKRLEQIEGISLVDVGGLQREIISVQPNYEKLRALNISETTLLTAIKAGNVSWGSINVKDGQYRYYVKVASTMKNPADIMALPVRSPAGRVVTVEELADVRKVPQRPFGYHLSGSKEAIVIAVHKQEQARMITLIPKIRESLEVFRHDYPQLSFLLTRDQSELLTAGISNLRAALLFGGIFAFAILFVFMKDYRLALIMGISIPVSLMLSFLIFFAFGISINVVSLSGLALGLGMLIDNAIIVLDNISINRWQGYTLSESCVRGVHQVMAPLISSVLTTLAVFIPLIFLHGLSGALFFDQAVAVAAILGVSLLVSFLLLPLLYRLFFTDKSEKSTDSLVFSYVKKAYGNTFTVIWRSKKTAFVLLLLFSVSALWLGLIIPRSGLPELKRNEVLLTVDWNEPIGPEENKRRAMALNKAFSDFCIVTETDVANPGFIFHNDDNTPSRMQSYFMIAPAVNKEDFTNRLADWLSGRFPQARVTIEDSPNAFDQLFISNKPYIEARIRNSGNPGEYEDVYSIIEKPFRQAMMAGAGFEQESVIRLIIDQEKLALYKVENRHVMQVLGSLFDFSEITVLKNYGEEIPVRLVSGSNAMGQMQKVFVTNRDGVSYPLGAFVQSMLETDFKHITSDKKGVFQGIYWQDATDPAGLIAGVEKLLAAGNLLVDFEGRYFDDMKNLKQLALVLVISLALLYFILAAQFESMVQPIIILLTLPLGITGSLIVLYITGTSLNIMSAIGIIVMLGIMVNDAILKVDTINRLVRESPTKDKFAVAKAIHAAGEMRLKPILMTSLTTILALTPVLFSGGLGADLQRPLVYSVIGGLTMGTLTAIYFIPLAYFFISGNRRQKNVIQPE